MDTRAAGDVTPHLTTGDARHREHPIPLQDMIGTRLEDSVPRHDALHVSSHNAWPSGFDIKFGLYIEGYLRLRGIAPFEEHINDSK